MERTHQTCPKCGHRGCCTIWDNGNHHCHSSCGSFRLDTQGDHMEEFLEEMHKPYRKLKLNVVKKFDIKTGVDDTGKDVYRVYPFKDSPVPKYRYLPKDFSKNKGFRANSLFGMDKFNASTGRCIVVVEGEDDAPAAWQMLGENPAYHVVALPGASFSESLMKNCHSFLDKYKEIVICTDNDEAGDKSADRLKKIFPGKTSRLIMTKHKDPMEFLDNGDDKDFLFAFHNREKYVPEGIYNTPKQFLEILNDGKVYDYVPTPFSELNNKIKGTVRGELMIVLGEEGKGKTEVLRAIEYNLVSNHPEIPIAVLHMEETDKICLTTYACYKLEKDVRDPDHAIPQSEINDAISDLTKAGNLYLFSQVDGEEPEAILDKVRYFATVCGVQYIFIDPIQQLAYSSDTTRTEEQVLSKIAVKLEKLASELNVGIILTAHVNDDGQTRSSRMIGKSASIRLHLHRDHMDPDPVIRNTTDVLVTKNRPFSKTGHAGKLLFNPDNFTIKES